MSEGCGSRLLLVGTAGADAPFSSAGRSGGVGSGVRKCGSRPRSVFSLHNLYYNSSYAPFAVDYYGIVFAVTGVGQLNLCSSTAVGCGTSGYGVHSVEWR